MNCPECGVPCHEDGTCPKCGGVYYIVKKGKRGSRGKGGGAGFLVLVAVVVSGLFYLLAKTPGCSSSSPQSAARVGTFTVQPNTFGCKTLDDYNQLARLAGDLPAFERSMRESVLKGVCIWLPVGKEASLEEYKMTADAAKIRVQGETQSYWIPGKSAK